MSDERGLESLRKLDSRLSFRMTGNSSGEEGKNASGVHAHKEIKNSQKRSRAIGGALGEDSKARTTVGAHSKAVWWDIIGPAGFGIRLTRVQITALCLATCVIARESHFAHG